MDSLDQVIQCFAESIKIPFKTMVIKQVQDSLMETAKDAVQEGMTLAVQRALQDSLEGATNSSQQGPEKPHSHTVGTMPDRISQSTVEKNSQVSIAKQDFIVIQSTCEEHHRHPVKTTLASASTELIFRTNKSVTFEALALRTAKFILDSSFIGPKDDGAHVVNHTQPIPEKSPTPKDSHIQQEDDQKQGNKLFQVQDYKDNIAELKIRYPKSGLSESIHNTRNGAALVQSSKSPMSHSNQKPHQNISKKGSTDRSLENCIGSQAPEKQGSPQEAGAKHETTLQEVSSQKLIGGQKEVCKETAKNLCAGEDTCKKRRSTKEEFEKDKIVEKALEDTEARQIITGDRRDQIFAARASARRAEVAARLAAFKKDNPEAAAECEAYSQRRAARNAPVSGLAASRHA